MVNLVNYTKEFEMCNRLEWLRVKIKKVLEEAQTV